MLDYKKLIRNREHRLKIVNKLKFIPSKTYLKIVYFVKTGKQLNLSTPKTFCEKQNWLKLHDINPLYTELVDKIEVRNYIRDELGDGYCFPILGTWKHFNEIDFDKLPDKFVLKCNHDSGSVKIIEDKSKINYIELENFFENRLKIDAYSLGREYPYRDIVPQIYAEKYMVPDNEKDIKDYKFFCFNGKPEILFVATDRSTECKFDFYDMEWNHLDIENIHPQSGEVIERPRSFDEMKKIAAILSKGMKFVRIDLYEINGRVYFGEFTFFHGGGFWPMKPEKWEYKLGEMIQIT